MPEDSNSENRRRAPADPFSGPTGAWRAFIVSLKIQHDVGIILQYSYSLSLCLHHLTVAPQISSAERDHRRHVMHAATYGESSDPLFSQVSLKYLFCLFLCPVFIYSAVVLSGLLLSLP